jgi:hypothetical protein
MYHCHVRYPTHYVEITHDDITGRVQCFKYNQCRCDFEIFDQEEIDQISDYIMRPFAKFHYYVNLSEDGDSPE